MNNQIDLKEIRILAGPNVWSVTHHQLIQVKITAADLKNIDRENVGAVVRTLADTHNSRNHGTPRDAAAPPRSDSETITMLGQACALLQSVAGMSVEYAASKYLSVDDAYLLAFGYEIAEGGRQALDLVCNILQSPPEETSSLIDNAVLALTEVRDELAMGPSTAALAQEALRRGIPVRRLNQQSALILGHGRHIRYLTATIADSTSCLAVDLAGNKEETKRRLASARIPVPQGVVITSEEELASAVSEVGMPVVIKPLDGNHGRAVCTNITSLEKALEAFRRAVDISPDVIVEKFIPGDDYRILVINYKLVAAAKRVPACVTGDGRSTIAQLTEEVNRDPRRGEGHTCTLTKITIDDATLSMLAEQELSPDSVPAAGQVIALKHSANLSSGGTAEDVTKQIHPYNVFLAERAARIMGLDICGIDLVAVDITQPANASNAAIVEINAAPGLRMHLAPSKGEPINVAEPIIRMLYPAGQPARIPLVAVTGTNGKTTTTRLIAHMAALAGHHVGFCTTDGIFISGKQVESGDCSGPSSARVILADPTVDFAVLECARGGLLRSGLGYDQCSTSIITNVSEDHLGLGNIHSLEDLAHVKGVIARSTMPSGCAILNAEDDLVYDNYHRLQCQKALFGLAMNERIEGHCAEGGLAATIHHGYFTIWQGTMPIPVVRVEEVPLTLGGRCEAMMSNILPAMLAAVSEGIAIDLLHHALLTFKPSPDQTPGRMNFFEIGEVRVLLDYAHNPAGFTMLKKFLEHTPAPCKVGIIAGTGDRRDQDIIRIGSIAAGMFDQIIIRHDKDGRGRSNEEITRLLETGIRQSERQVPFEIISDEGEALSTALDAAVPGCLVVLCADDIGSSMQFLQRVQEETRNNNMQIA